MEGLIYGGKLHFKTDWASHIAGRKFTVFACFYFVFEGNFPSTSPREAYIWKGDLTGVFCVTGLGGLYLEGLIHEGAYFWNFTVLNQSTLYHSYRDTVILWYVCIKQVPVS